MKLGILSDIHENVRELRLAIDRLSALGAERFVVLGDVFETGKSIEQTVGVLREVSAVGVWGNHDIGLCFDPDERACRRYSAEVLGFMGGLQPRLEIDGCLFAHVEPWLDPHRPEEIWYIGGPPDSPEKLARCFGAVPHRAIFLGHLHRWLLGTPEGLSPWRGEGPVCLDSAKRHLVVIHAVYSGRCALFDTQTNWLAPVGEG